MLHTAIERIKSFPKVYMNPLADMDDDIVALLRKHSSVPAERGKIFIKYERGNPSLANRGRDIRPMPRHRLLNVLRGLRDKLRQGVPAAEYSALITLLVTESGIDKTCFLIDGMKIKVLSGIPFNCN